MSQAEREAPHLPDPQKVADNLHSAAIHLLRAFKARDKASGVNPAQLSALSVLYFMGPLTITKLARAEGVRPPTVSRLVKDMERLGLVMREKAENDARSTHVSMTPKGTALFERARVTRLMALTKALNNLSKDNLETLEKAANLMENAARAVRGN
jgi:DNA-binding MarR family transcriptional regulator